MNSNRIGGGSNPQTPNSFEGGSNQTQPKTSKTYQVLLDLAQGAGLGGIVVTAVSPFLYFQRMRMLKEPIVLKNCYRGAFINGMNIPPQAATQFIVNSMMIKTLYPGKEEKDLSFMEKLFCSAVAGMVSGVTTVPGELLSQNYQALKDEERLEFAERARKSGRIGQFFNTDSQLALRQIAKETYKAGGARQFFRGSLALMARECKWTVTYLTLSGAIADFYKTYFESKRVCDFLGSGTAGVIGGVFTSPSELLRAQKQNRAFSNDRVRSYWEIAKSKGLKGMFDGLAFRCTVVAFACILMSEGKRFLNHQNHKIEES